MKKYLGKFVKNFFLIGPIMMFLAGILQLSIGKYQVGVLDILLAFYMVIYFKVQKLLDETLKNWGENIIKYNEVSKNLIESEELVRELRIENNQLKLNHVNKTTN